MLHSVQSESSVVKWLYIIFFMQKTVAFCFAGLSVSCRSTLLSYAGCYFQLCSKGQPFWGPYNRFGIFNAAFNLWRIRTQKPPSPARALGDSPPPRPVVVSHVQAQLVLKCSSKCRGCPVDLWLFLLSPLSGALLCTQALPSPS